MVLKTIWKNDLKHLKNLRTKIKSYENKNNTISHNDNAKRRLSLHIFISDVN